PDGEEDDAEEERQRLQHRAIVHAALQLVVFFGLPRGDRTPLRHGWSRFVQVPRLVRVKTGAPGNGVRVTTLELNHLFEQGEEEGCVDLTVFNELSAMLDLDEEAVDSLMQQLLERGIEVRDDCGREEVAATTY